jgi:hypothetical protein
MWARSRTINVSELTPRQIERKRVAANLAESIDDVLTVERDRPRRLELIRHQIERATMLGERHGREQVLQWRKRA